MMELPVTGALLEFSPSGGLHAPQRCGPGESESFDSIDGCHRSRGLDLNVDLSDARTCHGSLELLGATSRSPRADSASSLGMLPEGVDDAAHRPHVVLAAYHSI
jgi:hypothetical protein